MKLTSILFLNLILIASPVSAEVLVSTKIKRKHAETHLLNDARAFQFIKSTPFNKLIVIQDVKNFSSKNIHNPDYETFKLQHYYKGLEVVGSMIMHHQFNKQCRFSYKLAIFKNNINPKSAMPKNAAIKMARNYLKIKDNIKVTALLKILPTKSSATARLVYWMNFKSYEGRLFVIDAQTGERLLNISKRHHLAPVTVYSGNYKKISTALKTLPEDENQISNKFKKSCQVISTDSESDGSPLLLTPSNCHLEMSDPKKMLTSTDKSAMRAYQNTQYVLKYYFEKHGRNSYDDKGSEVINVVHAGNNLDNAYWDEDKNFMAYGDGDGEKSKDYTYSLDLAGHELTHGITAFTAKLLGEGEAGALNESYSDFFGIMISHFKNKNEDWSIGRDIYDPDGSSDEIALRSIAIPGRFKTTITNEQGKSVEVPFPDKMSEKLAAGKECNDENDYCEIHANSTIPSHAAYLIVKAVGEEIAAQIYYIVLTQRLTSTADFQEAANDTLDVCGQLYDSNICQKIRKAFVTTEILK